MMRALAWVLLAATVALTLVPPWLRPATALPHAVEHFAVFLGVGGAFACAYRGHAGVLGLCGIVFIGLLEALQMLVPGRHARLTDFFVNAAGLCAGIVVAGVLDRMRR